ncbi:Sec14p-like phosphatidylinositol transfer family protein [Euphorbia peplus]|nr:Sec14p-like phosphatidylinositol transfer family protein [Euphorbia peplus]
MSLRGLFTWPSNTEVKQNGYEIEQNKVGIMRERLQRQHADADADADAKDVDDLMMRRFLRANELDIEKAETMLLKYLSWKRSLVPNGYISPSEIPTELGQNKLFMQGFDKSNRPIVVVLGAKHIPYKGNLDHFKRFIVFTLDKIFARMPPGQEKFLAIADIEGWGYSHCDIRAYVAAISIMQDYYPERLAKFVIVHVPYIFMTAWKVIYPFIDTKVKNKIVIVENEKLRMTLLEDIEESQLPDIYGGKLSLVPIQDC